MSENVATESEREKEGHLKYAFKGIKHTKEEGFPPIRRQESPTHTAMSKSLAGAEDLLRTSGVSLSA
ncbi:hypothetical protein HZH66_006513 [Vespula vulgaris]|uniref:Uncharacterized protein n=1 Tax=Vespula vulgaris TaxID=7454 RepID=A0A834K1Z6_VESVU|nr:hypothetical protein HZH66_006513 [Vespula vulgaris]